MTRDNALILIREVQDALARGTQHYNKAGHLLSTTKEIMECMVEEGGVSFQPASVVERVQKAMRAQGN